MYHPDSITNLQHRMAWEQAREAPPMLDAYRKYPADRCADPLGTLE